jgi:hypothetical protein
MGPYQASAGHPAKKASIKKVKTESTKKEKTKSTKKGQNRIYKKKTKQNLQKEQRLFWNQVGLQGVGCRLQATLRTSIKPPTTIRTIP